MEIIGQIFTVLFSIFSSVLSLFFTLFAGIVAGMIATYKGRNPLLWGFASLFFPWLIIVLLILPRKYSNFEKTMYQKPQFKGKNPVISSLISLSAIVAKSDGAITKNEISIIRDFIMKSFKLSPEELDEYNDVFDYAKSHPEEYREYTSVILSYYRRRDIIMGIAYLLVSVGMADQSFSEKEDRQIWLILQELGLSQYEYQSIKNAFTGQSANGNNPFENTNTKKQRYAKVLDVSPDASFSDIKKAYRKQAKAYHPDTIASKGMSTDYVEYSNKKLAEINEAYDFFKGLQPA